MPRLVPKIYPNDVNENIPIGISFPLTVGTQRQNFVTTQQVHSNLKNLIMTMKGERLMQPNFGSDLYNLLFEQMDEMSLRDAALEAIKSAVEIWMPQVQINNIKVKLHPDRNLIHLSVNYWVEGWDPGGALNLEVKV
tara:strand:- start:84 stop:494 length:411 start_codon:yes stop_codon:yes gene_type:complete